MNGEKFAVFSRFSPFFYAHRTSVCLSQLSDWCAVIVIDVFLRPGLSADDRRTAMPESAFKAFSGLWGSFSAFQIDSGKVVMFSQALYSGRNCSGRLISRRKRKKAGRDSQLQAPEE